MIDEEDIEKVIAHAEEEKKEDPVVKEEEAV